MGLDMSSAVFTMSVDISIWNLVCISSVPKSPNLDSAYENQSFLLFV